MGSGCSQEVLKTLKSEVSRSLFVASPLRCDPNRGQRGKQDFNDAGKNIVRTSGMASTMVSSTNGPSLAGAGRRTIVSSTCSTPGGGVATHCSAGHLASSRVAGSKIRYAWRTGTSGGVVVGRASAARWLRAGAARSEVGDSSLASHRSSDVSSGRGAVGCSASALRARDVRGSPAHVNSDGMRKASGSKDSSVVVMHGHRMPSAFDLDSVFVPHSRLFSLCSSVVSKVSNSSQSIYSCGEHGSALGQKNSCNVHAAEVRGGTKALYGPAYFKTRARRFSGRWKSFQGVQQLWPVLHVLIILLSHLGQAE